MKALIIDQINGPIVYKETITPEPKEGQALYKVLYSALNHRDLYISQGLYAKIQLPVIPGSDACVLDEITGEKYIINPNNNWGTDERAQSPYYHILGMPTQGTLADYICIDKSKIFPKPAHLSDAEAAALPLAGLTAYRALCTRAQAQKGEKVLISGIGGGVALFAMQFAIALGCEVYVTSSSQEKINKAIELGAKGGFLYTDENWHKTSLSNKLDFDVIIDSAGGTGFNKLIAVAAPGGRIAIYGGTKGKVDGLSPQIIFWKQLSILGSTMGSDNDFKEMVNFVNTHKIKPIVQHQFHIQHAQEAFELMNNGQQFGKIVISHS